ncbi:MAG: DUF1971 domain-containing protein [Pseudomonadota bacterium]
MSGQPPSLRASKATLRFAAVTLPGRPRRSDRTKPGVWGRIAPLEGTLHLAGFDETGRVIAEEAIPAGAHRFVQLPQEPHLLAPDDDTVFQVAFLREADAAEPQSLA